MIGQVLLERLDNAVLKRRSGLNRKLNHASEVNWANVCMRRLCLLRECPENQSELGIDLLRKFEEGTRQERMIAEELSLAEGVEVVDAGSDKEVLVMPDYELVAELDMKVKVDGGNPVIVEAKSCDPGFFRMVEMNRSAGDLLRSPSFYLNMYPAQLWTQMLARKEREGMWLFKNRSTGKKHVIETNFDDEGLDIMGPTFEKIKVVNGLVAEKKAPDASPCDGCGRCSFKDFCFTEPLPRDAKGPHVDIIRDEDTDAKAARWKELKAKISPLDKEIKEMEKIGEDLKKMFRGRNVLIGDLSVRVKSSYPKTVYNVPDNVKAQYASSTNIFNMTIEDLGGGL